MAGKSKEHEESHVNHLLGLNKIAPSLDRILGNITNLCITSIVSQFLYVQIDSANMCGCVIRL